jgi:hypothetical protein
LLALLVSTYLISAFAPGLWARVLQTVLFLVAALIAVWSSRVSRLVRHLVTVIVLGGSIVALVLTLTASNGPAAGAGFAWIALMLLLAVILILERVLTGSEVTLQSIFGAISAYMILGLMFAAAYAAMSKFGAVPFFANGQPGNIATFQYFSFTTLTTVGYGDFTSAAAAGRTVAMLEALIGQVFLITLVGKLVAAYRAPRVPEGRTQPARPRHPGRRQVHRMPAARTARATRPQYRHRPPHRGRR